MRHRLPGRMVEYEVRRFVPNRGRGIREQRKRRIECFWTVNTGKLSQSHDSLGFVVAACVREGTNEIVCVVISIDMGQLGMTGCVREQVQSCSIGVLDEHVTAVSVFTMHLLAQSIVR